MIGVKLKCALVLVLVGAGYWTTTLPEHFREQGRNEERSKFKSVSDSAKKERDRDYKKIETDLKTERENHEKSKIEFATKFDNYVADVRAGRLPGLRIARSDICTSGGEKAQSTSRTSEETTVRLPRNVEEGLFRFANDRDQIIADFESFKTEVRLAKCFAD